MKLGGGERSDLVLALHSGEREPERWRGFLSTLAGQCSGDAAALAFARPAQSISEAAVWTSSLVPGAAPKVPSGASGMRPGRVYALEELIEPPDFPGRENARRYEPGGMRFGRLLHLTEPGVWSAWLAVYRSVGDLAAVDSALLTALAPHLAVAMGNFAQLEDTRLRVAIATDLLSRAQIEHRTVAADGHTISTSPGGAACKLARSASEEQKEAARLITQLSATPFIHRTHAGRVALAVPIASGELAAHAPSGVTLVMREVQENTRAAQLLRQLWPLTASEARLVMALAAGKSLAAAAEAIGVTIETARNYSKRIYAKTGASGQAALVGLTLTSVATLA